MIVHNQILPNLPTPCPNAKYGLAVGGQIPKAQISCGEKVLNRYCSIKSELLDRYLRDRINSYCKTNDLIVTIDRYS